MYEKVRRYCFDNRMTIRDFERLCNLANGTVGGWRRHGTQPRLNTLKRISAATGISIDDWVKDTAA